MLESFMTLTYVKKQIIFVSPSFLYSTIVNIIEQWKNKAEKKFQKL